jgi:acetolactate synthase-1/2/3 large subunit
MNGAEAIVRTLVGADVDVCFANPGTSEMHFVSALDRVPEMRSILCLFEGVATGAADGYARMADRPAASLLHLGPGQANGLANLHNAKRAKVPLISIVGDHATYHKQYDSPLESDIEAAARTVSGWVGRADAAANIGMLTAQAVMAANGPPSTIATLIVPADVAWGDDAAPVTPPLRLSPATVDDDVIAAIASVLRSGEPVALLLGGQSTRERVLRDASRIAAGTGARLLTETAPQRLQRGAGLPNVERLQYRAEAAAAQLSGLRHLVLVDSKSPVSFFAYPGMRSDLVPSDCLVHVLCAHGDDVVGAVASLADRVAGDVLPVLTALARPDAPSGPLTAATFAAAIGRVLPEGAIVVDESNTAGIHAPAATIGAPPHDWLRLTGGAIGIGLPLALGAAIAAPDRPVFDLQADGSAMYTFQALWTMARENADVTVIVLANRSYAILRAELDRTGATGGRAADALFDLTRPDLDFVSLAKGLGVEAERVATAEDLTGALERAVAHRGPNLIEAVL